MFIYTDLSLSTFLKILHIIKGINLPEEGLEKAERDGSYFHDSALLLGHQVERKDIEIWI